MTTGLPKPHPFDGEVKAALDVARAQQMRVDGRSLGERAELQIAYKSQDNTVRTRRYPMTWPEYLAAVTYWEKTGLREKKRSAAA